MPATTDHYRVVYICTKTEGRIISMTHVSLDKASSMCEMLNQYTVLGRFRAEDEWDELCDQIQTA